MLRTVGIALTVAVKGAPEGVIDSSTHRTTPDATEELPGAEQDERRAKRERTAEDGLRVGLARNEVTRPGGSPYEDSSSIGLVGPIDPPLHHKVNARRTYI